MEVPTETGNYSFYFILALSFIKILINIQVCTEVQDEGIIQQQRQIEKEVTIQ
jgi:hypothetical protein